MVHESMGAKCARLLAGMLMVVVAIGAMPARARACSGGPPPGERAESARVIVVGRVIGLEIEGGDPDRLYARVSIQVDRFLKGSAPNPVSYVDGNSVSRVAREGELYFGGSGGTCGTLDYDPTGKYVLALLDRSPDGSYGAGLGGVVFADEPSQLREGLESFGLPAKLPGLPATGGGAGGLKGIGDSVQLPLGIANARSR